MGPAVLDDRPGYAAPVLGLDRPSIAAAPADDGTGRAGRLLGAASLVPALLATAWVLAAFPFAATGRFHLSIVAPVAVVFAAVLVPVGLSLVRRPAVAIRAPWWSVAAVAGIAVAFVVFAALTHSDHVIPRRDAGSYAQIGYWLARSGGLDYAVPLADFGPSPGLLGFASPAFYQPGDTVIPQFMTGWPTVLALAYRLGGWTGLLLAPTVIGGCAVLAVGGLAARLVGPRWAPLAAGLTAVAWPVLRSSQETLSEPLALLTLGAGACLLVDLVAATGAGERGARVHRHALATGLLLGSGELVRIDFGVDFAFVLPLVGWLWLTRRPGAPALLAGAVVGGLPGVLDCVYVTEPYVAVNWASVKLMLVLLAAMAVATAVAGVALRRHGGAVRERRWWRPVPAVGAGAVVLVGLGLFVRPWVSTDHSVTDPGIASFVATMQQRLGLPVDGSRGYAERSLRWVAWYVGWPLLVAAFVGGAILVWRVLRGRERRWLPVLLVYLCPAVLVLLRPGITPDHPWADRRLVVEVVPCVVLLGTWATAALVTWTLGLLNNPHLELVRSRRIRDLLGSPATARVAGLLAVVAYLVPAGFALVPVSVERTEQGETALSAAVCGLLGPTDSVVLIDQQWMPVIRAECGLPVAQLVEPSPEAVARVTASIRAVGRTPVIAGSQVTDPGPLGLTPTGDLLLDSAEDQQRLVDRASGTQPLFLRFWSVRM